MTLITIISKDKPSLIPIIFEYKNKIKHHILIYDIDKEEIQIAKELKKSLKKLANKYNLNYKITLIPIDEDKKSFYQKSLKKIKSFNYKTLALNISEADPTMSIIYANFVLKENGFIFSYDKFDNTYNLISKDKYENKKIKNSMKLEDYLLLLNYEIKEKKDINHLYKQKPYLFKLIKNYKRFLHIRSLIKQKKYKIGYNKYYDNLLKKLNIINNDKMNYNRISSEIIEEYLFWHLLKLDFDDIYLNAKIITQREDNENYVENEFDILAIKNNQIYIFEMKFGSLSNTPSDIIYKLDALNDKFGEDTKSILISISKNKLFSNRLKLRGKNENILIHEDNTLNMKAFLNKLQKQFKLKEKAFLLGGCDLEMIYIEKLLKYCGITYFNKKLKWGAKLSEYKNILNKDYHFYGIELTEDITPPLNYTKIDHHNELSNNPSSLEQVCNILGKSLSRFEQLIAINDISHIKGLKKFNASEKEINHIRFLDRKFQGVTEKEEKIAEKEIKNIKYIENIPVIKTSLTKFSPITDKINLDEYIIYNDKELVYYGPKTEKLKNKINYAYTGKEFLGIFAPFNLNEIIKKIKAV